METFYSLASTGELLTHIMSSLLVYTYAVILALVLAVPLGICMEVYPPAHIFFDPLISFFQPIPGIAWIPLAMLWFGLGYSAVAFIIFLSAFFPMIAGTREGVRNVRKPLLKAAAVLGAGKRMTILDVIIPSASPFILVGIRTGLGYGWRSLVAAEMIASMSGLGFLITDARMKLRADLMLVAIITIGFLGWCIEKSFSKLVESKTVNRWRGA